MAAIPTGAADIEGFESGRLEGKDLGIAKLVFRFADPGQVVLSGFDQRNQGRTLIHGVELPSLLEQVIEELFDISGHIAPELVCT